MSEESSLGVEALSCSVGESSCIDPPVELEFVVEGFRGCERAFGAAIMNSDSSISNGVQSDVEDRTPTESEETVRERTTVVASLDVEGRILIGKPVDIRS